MIFVVENQLGLEAQSESQAWCQKLQVFGGQPSWKALDWPYRGKTAPRVRRALSVNIAVSLLWQF
jgi:hypothetical protein